MMKKILFLGFALVAAASAAVVNDLPDIDRTDKVHERRYLDSINVYARRNIRVNQAGFRPQDQKYAYVADKPAGTTFSVIDVSTGKEAFSGTTESLMENAPKPGIWVNGVFKSIGTKLYVFGDSTAATGKELLTKAVFSSLTTQGEYYVKIGSDTSAHFNIHPGVFNAIFEKALKFLGAQRCGNTNSWFHAACHLKDGSEVGHDLTGGWHDCGDHFKVSETMTYTAYGLITTYLVHQDRAEDRYGNSYNDTVFTDGIPDMLYEAKIGADFFFKLYKASKEDGLIAQHDMYHSVGVGSEDHQYWDKPEKQDAMPFSKGGPDRHVAKGVGTSSGMIAAVLAYFSVGWEPYDPVYADSLKQAAIDIYANVVRYNTKSLSKGTEYVGTDELKGFYPGGSSEANWMDDAAAGALALWYATKDTSYQFDLYKNEDINENETNYMYNNEPDDAGPYFRAGILGHISGFSPGGWMLDFENVHSIVLYSFAKLILSDKETAAQYNVGELERDTLMQRTVNLLRRLTDDGTQGREIFTNRFGSIKATVPYNLVWTSSDWGFNRYNMGAINQFFMLSELTSGDEKQMYLNTALDNIYYDLGANPWDVSFIMGVGDKNLNHPHNRAANPDGYNAGGVPYEYRCPMGALMGGSSPEKMLKDDWEDYTVTETCSDFTTTLFMPMLIFSNTLPVDKEGPIFSNIAGSPISDTSAIISWDANEVSLVTVFYNTTPDQTGAKSIQQSTASKGGALTINGLTLGETYYFYLEGMDTKRNISTDDNHGQWYKFTMVPSTTTISGVTICQVDNRSAKIYWWSSDRLNGVVNYGTSTSALTEAQSAEGGAVMFHEANLTNLKAGTTYYFSVSSGATTDNNGGTFYSFTTATEATYADIDIFVKPSSYQASCTNWEDCYEFIIYMNNNDTMSFQDFEVRLYLGSSSTFAPITWTPLTQNWNGSGTMTSLQSISFGNPTLEDGQYYLPISIKDTLHVSGQMLFQVKFTSGTFKDFQDGWSIKAHTASTDPEQFSGIPLEKGPLYGGSETDQVEDPDGDGVGEVAITRDPYITVYYHGKLIYGYGPGYTPENGPQTIKTVSLNFTSPFVTPRYSVEKEDAATTYEATSKVSPTGFLDDFELNGFSMFAQTTYVPSNRKDSLAFKYTFTADYGNNYAEFVSWHNHGANNNGSYDCACAIVRSNVEIDSITNPPEKRYLVFALDTVTAYTGKVAEVRLVLLDSAYEPLADDISVLISSESGFATFYTSSDAVNPVERIDLIKGEAVFYVKSSTPTETVMKAVGNSTATYNYATATAVLVIKDLPPWPIIDEAKMVDQDCDKIPDAMAITLSNEYVKNEGQSFNSIRFVYNGDTLTSSKLISENGKDIVVGIELPNKQTDTSPAGYIELLSNVNKTVEKSVDYYVDGISPALLSVSVLERSDTSTTDHVFLQFSEEIKTPSAEWPLKLYPTDQSITVKNVSLYNEEFNIWEFEIGFGTDKARLIEEGMKATLLPTSTIRDISGNGVSQCTPDTLTVLLKVRPIPMTYASISDKNDDGYAEHVEIQFAKALDARHIPDSISVVFGSATPETLTVASTMVSLAADSLNATIDLDPAFALGNTNGPYDGELNGKEVTGAGQVIEHLGAGAAYEFATCLAEDFAGPVFTLATIPTSQLSDKVLLTITVSEPIVSLDNGMPYFSQKRGSTEHSISTSDGYSAMLMGTTLTAIYSLDQEMVPNDGDYVRMLPANQGLYSDKHGNLPATNAPWIPVSNKGTNIKFKITLQNNISVSDGQVATSAADNKNFRLYVLNPKTKLLDKIEKGTIVPTSLDTTGIHGAIWKVEMSIPRGASSSEAAAWDSLRVRLNMPLYSNLGSYVNRISAKASLSSSQYLSSEGKIFLYMEWANLPGTGLQSEDGRSVGTGAYIYKALFNTTFVPNKDKDYATIKKFSGKNSYDKTASFGVKRIQ